MIPKDKIE
jgi:hypothetical protein